MKKLVKQLWKYTKWFLITFFSTVLCYLLVSWITSNISTSPKEYPNKNTTIYALSNGVHVDIIIPVKAVDEALYNKLNIKAATQYIAFGWGDKGFYVNTPTWGDLTVKTAITAIFLKSPSAMHVTEYQYKSKHWNAVKIAQEQVQYINNYIGKSFRENDKKFVKIPSYSYGKNDAFYEANGSYSCLQTCNTWTNDAFKESAIKTSVWTPWDWGVIKYLK
jgi:uncharacterized protein (TIGR02117 family)